MPIIYIDRVVKEGSNDRHPSLVVDETNPCYQMVREAIDGKSVFHWNKNQAYQMYKYYVDGYHNTDLVDEFGETVGRYDFEPIIKKSHYLIAEGKKMVPSLETIEELWAAVEMEKKILASNGTDDENS